MADSSSFSGELSENKFKIMHQIKYLSLSKTTGYKLLKEVKTREIFCRRSKDVM